ncbi:MAG: c-type cytochrome [Gemmobacter sp.]|nr:c-type cytochrome [Gemmobacter sp.]
MKLKLVLLAALATSSAPAFAAGDAAKGEALFRQCQTCHSAVNDAGEVVAGKGAKVGPNLYGMFGRQAGTAADFNYGPSIVAAGAAGLMWDEATFTDYVQDPVAFLRTTLNDRSAKSKMSFKLKNEAAAADVYAYLIQFSPEAAPVTPKP